MKSEHGQRRVIHAEERFGKKGDGIVRSVIFANNDRGLFERYVEAMGHISFADAVRKLRDDFDNLR